MVTGFLRRLSAIWICVLAFAVGHPCHAQGGASSDSAAAARTLFDEARALMDAKDYAHACPKFEESYRLNPGGGTILNLALCNELLGKTATAWANFQDGLRLARRDGREDREKLAREHIDALEPKLSKLTLEVPEPVRVKGLEVRRNGVEIGEAAWGASIPVDPGVQVIEASAPGKSALVAKVTLAAGERRSFALPQLSDAATPNSESVRAPPASGSPPGALPQKENREARADGSGQRIWGLVLAGTGVAAAGAGTYFALHAKSLENASGSDCPSATRCSPSGIQESRDAVRNADFATGAFVAAAVLGGAGAVLFFTAPSGSTDVRAGAAVSPAGAAFRVWGAF